ncbi:hypothetical protein BDY17DRAFT_289318 [Neohortaea acidophila]|uniref:Ubiquitin carboxyl-terminal hydrolase n=1 Tax=Neohortaea acidophila TaxID=245834 RepID=A0A6A6Q5R2_9PEZI|nr:uncharacterized protein BDY17DRAFT_289318 [Neohortaea acidophila]KAF2487632.1 hypothetical protein BDY17DRAFT_289318 [Neohortaea acidophila]
MPDRPLTVATYAAGASLAAITLVYVFGPTFFFDDEAANSSRASRKKGVVGLVNNANDCFINSVLQALSGLPELRLYLIREVHRRKLDGPEMYNDIAAAVEEQRRKERQAGGGGSRVPEWMLLSLQQGLVTAGLKDVLDALNERPIYKKTISAQPFILVVERAFRTRISRSQQDAQELLQLIAERLSDENHAGRRVRRQSRRGEGNGHEKVAVGGAPSSNDQPTTLEDGKSTVADGPRDSKMAPNHDAGLAKEEAAATARGDSSQTPDIDDTDAEEQFTFPFEGKLESQVECSYCHFKPKPHVSSFVTLTLNVPQSAGSLNSCFDGMFKQEHIDDFTCDRCRLDHALQVLDKQLDKSSLSEPERTALEANREKLEAALREDPEKPPADVKLPVLSTAPKRRISRHMRISNFPRILSLHLSRSVWDVGSSSSKNTAKVAFPETLSLGGLLDRNTYRLLAVVTHKGGHNSGHYETFRRQFLSAPYSTPTSMGTDGIFGNRPSPMSSPRISTALDTERSPTSSRLNGSANSPRTTAAPLEPAIPSPSTLSSQSSASTIPEPGRASQSTTTTPNIPLEAMPTPGLPPLPQDRQVDTTGNTKRSLSLSSAANRMRRKKGPDRWWRISDDKVKECKTSEVLGMQREVYLLFYELASEDAG